MAARTRRGGGEARMSLGEHLLELRKRLFISAIAILLGAVAGWFASGFVWDALREPILEVAKQRDASINYTTVTEAFDLRIAIALTIGIVATSPVWLYQIWAFIVPGLVRKEKQYALGFLLSAVPLFLAGAYSGWWVVPHIVELLTGFAPDEDATLLTAKGYLEFVLKLVLAVGIAFVLPVFLVLLNLTGVLSAASILKGWRIAILLIALFCAIATPAADVVSMFLLAIPMVLLYFIAAGIAWLHDRRVARRAEQFAL